MLNKAADFLEKLAQFPDWFKAIVLAGALIALVMVMNSKASAQQEQISKLREQSAVAVEQRTALKENVRSLKDYILRLEGKVDILLSRLK